MNRFVFVVDFLPRVYTGWKDSREGELLMIK